jgi:hypothetical protein
MATEYCPEYVEKLEKAAQKLAHSLQRIGGSYTIAEDVRKEHNEALDQYFEIQRDYDNT